jgi:hypothetical protein
MTTKIKLFQGEKGEEFKLETDVNKFIENKDVLGVSVGRGSGYLDIVVTYRE